MKNALLVAVLVLSACTAFDGASYHSGAPGYLQVDDSMYDGSRTVYLKPVSLFDPDDSLSVLRLGFYWETRMKQKVYFIISLPVGGVVEYENIKSGIGDLLIKNGATSVVLKKTDKAVTVKEKDLLVAKQYDVQIHYLGSLQLIQSMLKSRDVVVKVMLPGKSYEGRFDINSKTREKFVNNKNNAFNGASRFADALAK